MFSSQALNLEARKQGRDVSDISGEIIYNVFLFISLSLILLRSGLELLYSKPFLLCFTTETCMFNLSQRRSERVQFLNPQRVLLRTPRAISHI